MRPGEFTKDSSQVDGLSFYCKPCRKELRSYTYETNRVQILSKNREWREANAAYTLWASAKRRSKQRGTPFKITVDDVVVAWPADNLCPVLGIELKIGSGTGPTPESPSLDAFVPELGYVPGNIHVISFLANGVKRDVTDPSILENVANWMRKIGH